MAISNVEDMLHIARKIIHDCEVRPITVYWVIVSIDVVSELVIH